MDNKEWLYPYWKSNKRSWVNPMHGMCSYLAMFPPSLPNYFIKQLTNHGEKVLDPFSGRGTTVLEACLNGRVGIGNDLSPLAQVLTEAKVNLPNKEQVELRLKELRNNFKDIDIDEVDENIKDLFDNEVTLPQLVYLKESLSSECKEDIFITATILGILHGRGRKDGSSIYLSSSMPNTFAMSPNYLRKYKKSNNIKSPKQDVFLCLEDRVNKLYKNISSEYMRGVCFKEDAARLGGSVSLMEEGEIDLIFSSPPYLKVINYGTYNWIRLWFLNKDIKGIDELLKLKKVDKLNRQYGLSDCLGIKDYLEFMKDVICNCEGLLKGGGVAIFVIGDVANYNGHYIKLAEEVWNYAKEYTNLKCYEIVEDIIDSNTKVTKIWGNSKGKQTKVERILILYKGEMRKPNFNENIEEIFNYF